MQQWWRKIERWWWRTRYTIQAVMFPLICIQFVRTLLFPNPVDVFLLFALFLFYLGFLFKVY
ncbi:hypothetical protein [Paenibacillus mesotrionivorans]|jgi:hypothetical protein|uniref:Uncharacterized protein n=1 Tax=Paenibacillus mesotrionivorans TaxID=3160968 RepID=A0ACC7NWC1_9BACL